MKKYLVPLAMLILSPLAYAKAEVNVQALEACSLIENDFNRLLCYDKIMAGQSLGQVKRDIQEPKAEAKPQVNKKAEFGLEHKKRYEEQADEISAQVVKVKTTPRGELILTLENGQVWRQAESEGLRIKEGDSVVIGRGMFNSFLLKKTGSNRTMRVKRTD